MLSLPPTVRIWLAAKPADLRKSFDTLAALVREGLQSDPLSGDVFVFRNKAADRVKLLVWEADGYGGSLHIPSKRYIPEYYSVVVVGAEDVLDRIPLPLGPQFRLELCDGAEHVGLRIANGQTNARL
jgi:hypothetical protein